MKVMMMAIRHGRSDGLQEGHQERIVHQFIYDASCFGKFGGMRGVGAVRHAEKAISNLSRYVHLARGARNDVDLH